MIGRAFLAVGLLGGLVPACHAPAPRPVVTIVEGSTEVVDVAPPTRLDVVMVGRDGALLRCADMGGYYRPSRNVCEGVDY